MKLMDLTGQRFERLTVLKRGENGHRGKVYWLCQCDCGSEIAVRGDHLRKGLIRSCGCLSNETRSQVHRTHGGSHTRLYRVYRTMLARCFNPKNYEYAAYGGRGIRVCDAWKEDYVAFRDWALANGYDEAAPYGECTIDRIDVNGNYEPSNCRWTTMAEQQRNKRPREARV